LRPRAKFSFGFAAVAIVAAAVAVALSLGSTGPHHNRLASVPEPPALLGAGPNHGGCKLDAPELESYPYSTDANSLSDVQFVSASTGWVLGPDHLLATSDAGSHWRVQLTSRTSLWSALDFINTSTGWVIGARDLVATTDGGQRWRALPQTCPAIRSVNFVTSRVGFAIASGTTGQLGAVWGDHAAALLTTDDGGQTWHRLATPESPQSVCFYTKRRGWLGAHGAIYSTADGGRHWTPSFTGSTPPRGFTAAIALQCTGPGGGWAEAIGPGAAMSQEPHIGLHSTGRTWTALFAEQYFPHPGIPVKTNAPSSVPNAFSAINASDAAFLDDCTACGYGTAALALVNGTRLTKTRNIRDITGSVAASFTSPTDGWVIGVLARDGRTTTYRVVHTTDGGRSWHTQYSTPTTGG
jgi:photosystem II stability/assembly factor-like uncharacterized protein